MRFSGSQDFTQNRTQIFERSLRIIHKLNAGHSMSAEDERICSVALNSMLAEWQAAGIGVTLVKDITIFLRYGEPEILIGTNGHDATENYFETALRGDEAAAQTDLGIDSVCSDSDAICLSQSITGAQSLVLNGSLCTAGRAFLSYPRKLTVTSTVTESSPGITITGTDQNGNPQSETITLSTIANAPNIGTKTYSTVTAIASTAACSGTITVGTCGITTGDYCLIELDTGYFHRDTVKLTNQYTNALLLTSGLPSAASEDNAVFTYSSKCACPLDILSARIVTSSTQETPLSRFDSRTAYLSVSNKYQTGTPCSFWYEPGITEGTLSLYPAPDDCSKVIKALARVTIDDLDNSYNNVQFPKSWTDAVTYNLAIRIASEYQCIPSDLVFQIAQTSLRTVRNAENKNRTLVFVPKFIR